MKINNNDGINFPEDNGKKRNIEKNPAKHEQKSAEANSLDALASQGRAQVSFRGGTLTDLYVKLSHKIDNDKMHSQLKTKIKKLANKNKNVNVTKEAGDIIRNTKTSEQAQAKCKIIDKLLSDERLYNNELLMRNAGDLIDETNTPEQVQAKCDIIDKILSDERLYNNKRLMSGVYWVIRETETPEQVQARCDIIDKLLSDERLYNNENIMGWALKIIHQFLDTPEQAQVKCDIIDKILSDERLYNNENIMKNAGEIICYAQTPEQVQIANKILSDERLFNNENVMKEAGYIIQETETPEQAQAKCDVIYKILSDERLYNNENIMKKAGYIINNTETPEQAQIANKILSDERLYNNENIMEQAGYIIRNTKTPEQAQAKCDVIYKILSDERLFNNENVMKEAGDLIRKVNTKEEADELLKVLDDKELLPNQVLVLALVLFLDENNKITYQQLKKLNKVMGLDKTSKLNEDDTITAVRFIDVYGKKNINEVPLEAKHDLLRNLVGANTDLFKISDEMKQYFPLLPKNQEEYCTLLPALVRSMGIETNTLNDEQIKDFDKDLTSLSTSLSKLTDEEFNNLEITQEYNKDDFIRDVYSIVEEGMQNEEQEKQKVYDYFGFELKSNKNSSTQIDTEKGKIGFSIIGYPVNLNNGKKLAQITNPETKEIVEQLRPLVIKFSKNNPVICNNKELEQELNKIVNALPELRPQIGKAQHKTHDFDLFKHSLKVMQKVAQNPEFEKLNDSDKKIMLLASLLHDISKKEGYSDPTHATEGSFDSFYIARKFNLSRDEEIKLNELIKHHEWLNFVNSFPDEKTLDKRLKDTAYDLRHDNMLDMALIFTHADLKAVKKDDSFHDRTDGDKRTTIEGTQRSFGESAEYYASKIRTLIEQLKRSQPLLPVTPFPKASTIEKAVTKVNADGSTNIKGVYKDKDGLIVIKYNEVKNSDWEKIGFPKGSVSHGIKSRTSKIEDVNTGNIKFFAHGLDYPTQLIKFDAFSLPDSDALLSVSYAERPESKYRFFRPQGILLDCETKYIHGGGNTDSGSGSGKNIQEFKNNYIFDGEREEDRRYISDLIKEATGMTDKEYIQFVKENENKPLSEIEPKEIRTKIINAFAGINSNTRQGNREYNEMYISNPKPPMAVFAYNMDYDENTGNPVEFLNRTPENNKKVIDNNVYGRTKFLREYALERDIPFMVFGD